MRTAPNLTGHGKFKDLVSAIIQAVPPDLPDEILDKWLGKKKKLGDRIRAALLEEALQAPVNVEVVETKLVLPDIDCQLDGWKDFWKRYLKIEINVSKILIPAHQQGFDQLIVMPEEAKMTNNGIFDLCQRHFTCWRCYDDLDEAINHHDRHSNNGSYAIWVRDRQEADEENKNLSARYLWEAKFATQTYPERMVHGLNYWDRTKKHLDVKNWTLCAGSRVRGGGVPGVGYYSDARGVVVNWSNPDYSSGSLRARSAVSSPLTPSGAKA